MDPIEAAQRDKSANAKSFARFAIISFNGLAMDIRKAILIFTGTVCVALGVLGMFLPLMPTTVFLLMAAYCYSRSSERFHNWLLTNRLCGSYISNYKVETWHHRPAESIHPDHSLGLDRLQHLDARRPLRVTLILAAVAIGVTAHILWIRTLPPRTRRNRPDGRRLTYPHRRHRDRPAVEPFDGETYLIIRPLQGENVKQRQIMVRRSVPSASRPSPFLHMK